MIPNLGAVVLEKLQELGNHDVKRTIQHVAIQDLSRVFTDLLQGSKSSLRGSKRKGKKEEAQKWMRLPLQIS